MNDDEAPIGSPAHLFQLAECLDDACETTLGPTDSYHAAVALRLYAAFLEAATP